jgi:carboxyl-terminal processing protease
MRKLLAIIFLAAFIPAPDSVFGNPIYTDTSRSLCFENAARQLQEAITIMKKHYYRKDAVNWDSLALAAEQKLAQAETCEDAFKTVNWCFSSFNETHSFLMPPNTAALYNNDTSVLKTRVSLFQLMGPLKTELYADKGIAYLDIPWVSTTDAAICTKIADSIQQLISSLDVKGINKWIIDLRNNKGGNCWPMLAGIGPLLGEGVCGYFLTESEKVPISCQVSQKPYKMKNEKNWIVVLTGPKTSSSGEILALAFKGKEHTSLYGQPTAGFTTANSTYTLTDNSMLVLTVCQEADRNGKIYEGKILPDELISAEGDTNTNDAAKSAAIMFLHIQ